MQTFTHKDHKFSLELRYDEHSDKPWEMEYGHGIVSEWTRRIKRPGERVLCSDRGKKRYYDFAGSCILARTEWGFKSRKEAAAAVLADYERLRGWCNDEWNYVGVVVHLLDDDDDSTGHSASIWGVESDSLDYIHNEVARDLADECLAIIHQIECLGEPVA